MQTQNNGTVREKNNAIGAIAIVLAMIGVFEPWFGVPGLLLGIVGLFCKKAAIPTTAVIIGIMAIYFNRGDFLPKEKNKQDDYDAILQFASMQAELTETATSQSQVVIAKPSDSAAISIEVSKSQVAVQETTAAASVTEPTTIPTIPVATSLAATEVA